MQRPGGCGKKRVRQSLPLLCFIIWNMIYILRSLKHQDLWSSCLCILEARTLLPPHTYVSKEPTGKEAQIWGAHTSHCFNFLRNEPQKAPETLREAAWEDKEMSCLRKLIATMVGVEKKWNQPEYPSGGGMDTWALAFFCNPKNRGNFTLTGRDVNRKKQVAGYV